MTGRIFSFCAFVILICGNTEYAYAKRGIPIPIVWGHGEEMTELGDLPDDVSQGVAKELGTRVTVAFLHGRAHVFWLDLWTWNGRHVLHSGDKYWEPDSTAWQKLIGGDPSEKYGKPLLYRIPLLPALLSVAVVLYVVQKTFFKTEQEKLEALLKDERYQRRIQTLFGSGDGGESPKAVTKLDEERFVRAKNELIGEGVDADSAEINLRKVAEVIIANTNARINGALRVASQLDQRGDCEQSAEIYSQLIASLPHDDERLTYAQNCLAAVNEKRVFFTKEQSDEPAPPTTLS